MESTNYHSDIEYEIKPAGKLDLNFKELWQYKELFYFFTWRDIKVKYKQAYLGILWVVLQPLFMMMVFSFFFGKVLRVPSDGIPYPIFVYSGMMFWNIFSSGLSSSGDCLVSNANIIKKIYFPRLVIPISVIFVSVFDFIITFALFIGLILFLQIKIDYLKFIELFPLAFLITIVTTFGLGTLLSALNVKYRDFKYIIPFLIQATLFITPVIYPISVLPFPWIKYVLALNPLTGAIALSRAAIAGNVIDWNIIMISVVTSLLLLVAGLLVFKRTEAYFADLA
ncbi:phosphate ABC transporter permease [Sporocytophaga myxococcoides]|uniref:Transport permease protein n=1 Tax=Sporocytophaga myxococcoides TaxID=153721 RepID=A0A098LBK9_9BACT|nr:ABC transporter permease [Sporocytophaga myxococcoides]GAL83779.1 phosphate ABC transporter permease [Sporocytophaga myxococcoides]